MPPKISRQRKWQLKRAAKGLCTQCGRAAFRADRCRECYVKKALRRMGWDDPPTTIKDILIRWGELDRGVPQYSLTRPVPPEPTRIRQFIRWIHRWDRRIGGRRYA